MAASAKAAQRGCDQRCAGCARRAGSARSHRHQSRAGSSASSCSGSIAGSQDCSAIRLTTTAMPQPRPISDWIQRICASAAPSISTSADSVPISSMPRRESATSPRLTSTSSPPAHQSTSATQLTKAWRDWCIKPPAAASNTRPSTTPPVPNTKRSPSANAKNTASGTRLASAPSMASASTRTGGSSRSGAGASPCTRPCWRAWAHQLGWVRRNDKGRMAAITAPPGGRVAGRAGSAAR